MGKVSELKHMIKEDMDKVIIRINDRVTIVFEGHITKAQRGQTLAKILGYISIGGSRPFDDNEYKTISSAIFSTEEDSEKPIEFTDDTFTTDEPVKNAKSWIKEKLKGLKK